MRMAIDPPSMDKPSVPLDQQIFDLEAEQATITTEIGALLHRRSALAGLECRLRFEQRWGQAPATPF